MKNLMPQLRQPFLGVGGQTTMNATTNLTTGANMVAGTNQNTISEWVKMNEIVDENIKQLQWQSFQAKQLQERYATQQTNLQQQLQLLYSYRVQLKQFRQRLQQQQNADQYEQLLQQLQTQFQSQLQQLQARQQEQQVQHQQLQQQKLQQLQKQQEVDQQRQKQLHQQETLKMQQQLLMQQQQKQLQRQIMKPKQLPQMQQQTIQQQQEKHHQQQLIQQVNQQQHFQLLQQQPHQQQQQQQQHLQQQQHPQQHPQQQQQQHQQQPVFPQVQQGAGELSQQLLQLTKQLTHLQQNKWNADQLVQLQQDEHVQQEQMEQDQNVNQVQISQQMVKKKQQELLCRSKTPDLSITTAASTPGIKLAPNPAKSRSDSTTSNSAKDIIIDTKPSKTKTTKKVKQKTALSVERSTKARRETIVRRNPDRESIRNEVIELSEDDDEFPSPMQSKDVFLSETNNNAANKSEDYDSASTDDDSLVF